LRGSERTRRPIIPSAAGDPAAARPDLIVATPVRILRLAAGGEGVGKLDDGRTVFVPRTAPGDLVELRDVSLHARFAKARLSRVIEPGPGRTVPRCAHYLNEECGGCQLQHLEPAAQLDAKRVVVEDALRRIGRLDVRVPPVIPSDEWWEYRYRITLTVGPGRRIAGFHPLEQPGRVFSLEHCEIAAPALMRLWGALRAQLHLLPEDAEQLVLRLDREQRLHLVVKSRGDQAWGTAKRLAERLTASRVSVTVWWQPKRGAPRVVAGDRDAFPATVFEQVHPGLADRIRLWAIEQIGPLSGVHVWDLYAGIGETTDQLYSRGATVESGELDRRAVDLAERRWHEAMRERPESQRPEPAGVIRHVGRVEELIGQFRDPGAVIANPPRTGMDARVTAALLQRCPARIVYVACDPATLARDLARLCRTEIESPSPRTAESPSYRLEAVQPFDLFPQTAHVETVAVLEAL
jgi:23S rRNA (uracil1939-C5)-methyltransferase